MPFFKKFIQKFWPSAQPQPIPSYDTFRKAADAAASQLAEQVANDLAANILLAQPQDEEGQYLELGTWVSVQSSHVSAIHYEQATSQLQIEYWNGWFYQYEDIDYAEARSFYNAASHGKWVWDHLRLRGTVFGYQKPYSFLSGVSQGRPQWMGQN